MNLLKIMEIALLQQVFITYRIAVTNVKLY